MVDEKIINRLNAIRAKALAAAGTPEGDTFMAAFSRMMNEYNLSLSDLEVKQSKIHYSAYETRKEGAKQKTFMEYTIFYISELTDTEVVTADGKYLFFGTMADIQYADFIYKMIDMGLKEAWFAYYHSGEYKKLNESQHGKAIRSNFEKGFLSVIIDKLEQMIAEKKASNPGNSLIVIKKDIILAAMADLGLKPNQAKASVVKYEGDSAYAGAREGNKIKLKKEVSVTLKLTNGSK